MADDFNREGLAIDVDFSLPAPSMIRVLDRIALDEVIQERYGQIMDLSSSRLRRLIGQKNMARNFAIIMWRIAVEENPDCRNSELAS